MVEQHIPDGLTLVVETHVVFSLVELCRAVPAGADQVQALVAEGLLQPCGRSPDDWQFNGSALLRTRTALRLAQDLQLGIAGAAVVMDLLAVNADLRSQLRRR